MAEEEKDKSKRIDEQWKETAQQEKAKETPEQWSPPPRPDFNFFISSLAMETLIALGEMEHPLTKKKSVNLQQAQYLIDTIDMLAQKAKGNLSAEEQSFIEQILPDLKMRYVNKTKT